MDKKVESGLTLYEVNKQLMANERVLDPIELNLKTSTVREELEKAAPAYLMLLCNDRKDFTIFEFMHKNKTAYDTFEKDLKECLNNRGKVLTINQEDTTSWEIWIRDNDTSENFCYYLFDYSHAVLLY